MDDPAIAFLDGGSIRVNFGVFAGREATQAEIEELGRALLDETEAVTIVAERRTILDRTMEASVHQVRIELPADLDDAAAGRLLAAARAWASACIAERHAQITEA